MRSFICLSVFLITPKESLYEIFFMWVFWEDSVHILDAEKNLEDSKTTPSKSLCFTSAL